MNLKPISRRKRSTPARGEQRCKLILGFLITLAVVSGQVDLVVAQETNFSRSKLITLRFMGIESPVTNASLLTVDVACASQKANGSLVIVKFSEDSKSAFRGEGGARKTFEPTLVSGADGTALVYDESRDTIQEFLTDGNSIRSLKVPRDKIRDVDARRSPLVGISYDKDTRQVICLFENGVLVFSSWNGEVKLEKKLPVSHMVALKKTYDAKRLALHALSSVENKIVKVELELAKDEKKNAGREIKELSLVAIPQPITSIIDFAPISGGGYLVGTGDEIWMMKDEGASLVSLPKEISGAKRIFLDTLGEKVLLYTSDGKLALCELR